MYKKEDLLKGIIELGIEPTDTLLIHSSMKAIGDVDGGADTLLDTFIDYMKPGLLILPTHTWATINKDGDQYDPKSTPSCVGILSNLFFKREGVLRSLHPTHSVAAIGKNAEDYICLDNSVSTPAPWSGCWGELYRRNAKILFLGCSLNKNTFIHSVEEWCNIPNRLSKESIKVGIKKTEVLTHKAPVDDISQNYGRLKEPMLEKSIVVKAFIGDAESYLCDAKRMADLTRTFLEDNPDYFI